MKHFNPDLTNEQNKVFNLKGESSDAETYDNIMPVVDITPKKVKDALTLGSGTAISGTSTVLALATVYPDKTIRIYSATFQFTKDVACDVATGTTLLNVVQNGSTRNILALSMLTLTAQDKVVSASFPHGLLIDKNTSITFSNTTYAAGLMNRYATITFTVDD